MLHHPLKLVNRQKNVVASRFQKAVYTLLMTPLFLPVNLGEILDISRVTAKHHEEVPGWIWLGKTCMTVIKKTR